MLEQRQILIHYGELSTKGRNKKMFIQKLAEHIRIKTRHLTQIKIYANHDFMHLKWQEIPYEAVIDILRYIPGISRFEPVYPVEKNINAIKAQAKALFEQLEDRAGKTYRVVAKRSDKTFEYDTMQLQREIGFHIGDTFPELEVDLKQADYKLTVSVQVDRAYLSLVSYAGLGGLPYGTSGKGVLMLSGGIDSPIAGYLMMKRGMAIEAVHFSSPPYTSPQALQKTKKLAAQLAKYGTEILFHDVPFTKIQEAIKANVHDDLSMTVMRRMMLRIMDALLERQEAHAIITGESLGQVASQTLKSMNVINEVTSTPILRPLIATDKNDIIDLAEKIGTFAISNEPYEDCCTVFAPKSPRTQPKLTSVEEMEAALSIDELVKEAVANTITESIDAQYLAKQQTKFSSLL
ncbi:tRNA 4-thiouridine(8) synthase ThiI [Aerococcaceae bacterium NML130460]|nr:tRNA 4-thiouridine(8) synthase ThiI [Aerococcaceae bacterium NML130460]